MERIYGPYKNGRGWRVVVVSGSGPGGGRVAHRCETEEEAWDLVRRLQKQTSQKTVAVAQEEFVEYRKSMGDRESSLVTASYRLSGLLGPAGHLPLRELTPARAETLYARYRKDRAVDTHRGALALARSMGEWARRQKVVPTNPWTDVEPVGKKSHGKEQIERVDDLRRVVQWTSERADEDDRACAVLVALLLGLRAGEIVGLTADNLDEGGTVLRLLKKNKLKNRTAVRAIALPPELVGPLASRAERGRLFPYKRDWVRQATFYVCDQLGLNRVVAHSLRGSHATVALEAGTSALEVARSLGHRNVTTTRRSYAQEGSGRSADVGKVRERIGLRFSQPISKPEIHHPIKPGK